MSVSVVGGCSTTTTGAGSGQTQSASQSSAASDLASIKTKRIGQGVVAGVVVGALLGGAWTALRGGNAQQIAAGAAVGGALGAAGGAVFAAGVNKTAEQQANEQERYKKVIADTDTNIATYKRAASLASNVTKDERQRIASLNAQLAAGEITVADYKQQLSNARANVSSLDRLISEADSDINDMTILMGDTGTDEMKGKKAELLRQKASLTERRRLLLDAYDRVPDEVGLNI